MNVEFEVDVVTNIEFYRPFNRQSSAKRMGSLFGGRVAEQVTSVELGVRLEFELES